MIQAPSLPGLVVDRPRIDGVIVDAPRIQGVSCLLKLSIRYMWFCFNGSKDLRSADKVRGTLALVCFML